MNILLNPSFLTSGERELTNAQAVLIKIGEQSLDPLMRAFDQPELEISDHMEIRIMSVIVAIMKDHKSDRYFGWLKDRYRKAAEYRKILFAHYFTEYGDSRAVMLLRGYVERNKNDMLVKVYQDFRKAIMALGGNIFDLDLYFDYDFDDDVEE